MSTPDKPKFPNQVMISGDNERCGLTMHLAFVLDDVILAKVLVRGGYLIHIKRTLRRICSVSAAFVWTTSVPLPVYPSWIHKSSP